MPRATRIMPVSGVYAIQNTISGRVYVGSSASMPSRWHNHVYRLNRGNHHAIALQRSWNKHGASVFSWTILELVIDASRLVEQEQFWIDRLNAFHPKLGFNSHPNAASPRGHKHSADSRRKMSEYRKGRKHPPRSEAHREALRQAHLGKSRSKEAIAKQSAVTKGKPKNPEHAANIRAALVRRNQSDEMRSMSSARATERNRASAGQQRNYDTPEYRLKLRLANLDKTFSVETRAKMSAAAKIRSRSSPRSVEGKFIPSTSNDKSKNPPSYQEK